MSQSKQPRGLWLWYLLPIYLHFIGGIIAYFMLRFDHPRIAKDCLYLGTVISVVNFATLIILITLGFSFEEFFKSELFNDITI